MPKEKLTLSPQTVDEAFYRKIKPFKKRIIKRWLRKYYQRIPWASGICTQRCTVKGVSTGTGVVIDLTLVKPEHCATIMGIYAAASHYFDLDKELVTEGMIWAFWKLYKDQERTMGTTLRELYKGYPPKLTRTQAVQEMVARGFVDIRDVIKGWDKQRYSIIVNDYPFTWPYQFDSQSAGLQFLEGFGIPGYMGCPCPEQGQISIYKRYY